MHISLKYTWNILQGIPMVDQKTSLSRFLEGKYTKYFNIFSDHNGLKLKISNRRKSGTKGNVCKFKNTLKQPVSLE